MSKGEALKINPADYDYMDELPLEGWIWEFIRRNEGYKKLFSEFKGLPPKLKLTTREEALEALEKVSSILNLKERIEKEYCLDVYIKDKALINPHQFLIVEIEKMEHVVGIPNPDIRYIDFHPDRPIICGLKRRYNNS